MKYTITDTNREQGWVALTVTFDDGVTYDKRMMAPMDSEESIHGAIRRWLADYIPLREAEKAAYNPEVLEKKVTSFTLDDLPKTSIEQAAEQAESALEITS